MKEQRNGNSRSTQQGPRERLLFIVGVLNLLVGIYLLHTWYIHTVVQLYEVRAKTSATC